MLQNSTLKNKLLSNRLLKPIEYEVDKYKYFKSIKIPLVEFTNYLKSKDDINNQEIETFLKMDSKTILEQTLEDIILDHKTKRTLLIIKKNTDNKVKQKDIVNLYKFNCGYKLRIYLHIDEKNKKVELVLVDCYHLAIPTANMNLEKEYRRLKKYNYDIKNLKK